MHNGEIIKRKAGTPQGGVISPVLANLFLHYAFDYYMSKEFPSVSWVRYADDGVINCVFIKQAKYIIKVLEKRFRTFGLELNTSRTKIVYYKDSDRKKDHENINFDFLGYSFKPRSAKGKEGTYFTSFLPAISDKAKKAIRNEIRNGRIQLKSDKSLEDIVRMANKKIQGWINYYSHYYKTELKYTLAYINKCLLKWGRKKYKKKGSKRVAIR